jgi:tetratricopeptide (TPR) repeat protein
MRKLLPLFLFIFFCFKIPYAQAQVREKPELSDFYSEHLDKLKQCDENSTPNCTQIINKIIQQGKKDQVKFLDHLYFNVSYWYVTQSKYDSAKIFAQKALENPHPNLKFRSDLDAYNILGNCAYMDGNLNEAIDFYVKAAKILESGEKSLKLGYLYSNIAILLGETKNDKKQLEYLQKSYRILEELKDEKFIATVASNMALNYLFLADKPMT